MIVFFLRTLVLYLLLVGVIRLMGKRQVGQMEPAEFVVTMLSANLVTIPMQDFFVPVYTGGDSHCHGAGHGADIVRSHGEKRGHSADSLRKAGDSH